MQRCTLCGESGHDRDDCPRSVGRRRKIFDPWSDLSYEEHNEARAIVRENPDGMTLEEVGKVLGVTRERVRQIEVNALAKVADLLPFDSFVIASIEYELQECPTCSTVFLKDGSGLEQCSKCRPVESVEIEIEADPEPARDEAPAEFVLIFSWSV